MKVEREIHVYVFCNRQFSMANCIIDDPSGEQVHRGVGLPRISPNSGSIFYTPIVDVSLKPVVGMVFDSLESAIEFYKKYASASGFTVRKSTDYKRNDTVKLKYLCCSKQGLRGGRVFDTLSVADKRSNKRSRPSIRCGCNAAVKILLADDNKYTIYFVHEEHNHSLVNEEDAQFLPANRKVDHVKENMVQALSLINVGLVKAFNILRALYGGYGNVGATKNDFKNLKRDLNVYIGQFDSDMVVQRLMKKKEFLSNFSVEYTTKEDGTLNGLFWADDISKKNYYTFGDVVSFDATYRSNKYNLIFVPFTGIDNHNRNVNFGAALLGSETFESYKWLLQCFLKAFGHAPQVVVTDQDPAMKKAIEDVLPDTRHRLCMWHIWDKLSDKVGAVVCNNTKFKERMADIVWTDSLSPDEFEKEWDSVVNEFGLDTHPWLKKIFSLREDWIPAYYREENLSGLMRTTSRSESENHFFGKYCNTNGTLVEFLSHFDTAMEAQRYENRKNDHETRYTQPDIWSTFVLERQAAQIYTRTIFLDQQSEIDASINFCACADFQPVGDFVRFNIKDFLQPCTLFYQVMFRKEDMTVYCSCKRFEQYGLLCRHVFYVLRLSEIVEFPKNYILRRWTREAVPKSSFRSASRIEDCGNNSVEIDDMIQEIIRSNEGNINKLVADKERFRCYLEHVKSFNFMPDEGQAVPLPNGRRDRWAAFTGMSEPSNATLRVPVKARTKGCGTHRRMKSAREIAISQAGKKQRACSNCNGFGHNQRTCKVSAQSQNKCAESGGSKVASSCADNISES